MRRNLLDASSFFLAALNVINQQRQRRQIVWAGEGPTCSNLTEQVGLIDIGPRGRKRTQPSLGVVEHDAVFAPVLFACRQHEALSAPRMERVRNLELYAGLSVSTNCSPGLERKARTSEASGM